MIEQLEMPLKELFKTEVLPSQENFDLHLNDFREWIRDG